MSQGKHKVVNQRNKDTKKNVVSDQSHYICTNKCTRTFLQVCTALSGFAAKRTAFTVSPTSTVSVRMCVWVCICLCTGHPDTKNRKVSTNR